VAENDRHLDLPRGFHDISPVAWPCTSLCRRLHEQNAPPPLVHQRLLGDGGSYGLFANAFLGTPTAVHSAVVGLERLTDLIATTESTRPAADIAIFSRPEQATVTHADQLTTSLRSAGIAAWDLILTKSWRQHLRDLSALAIAHSTLIGARELDTHNYTIRSSDSILHTVRVHQLVQGLLDRCPHAQPPGWLARDTHKHNGSRWP
jgi:histidyl-tRNA synthetase